MEITFNDELSELTNGRKRTNWLWFIFSKIAGMDFSEFNIHYAI
ncbi:DUF1810 family protein [Flavobacterium caseinilyticum]|uniref:DUF1810 family protein n=1 Tax=Flavobacterium caseinilyticum TaxID=2541732 RepID=A0A4R5ASK0_9FLAO|nr:DUF1810 family protein [Flavobacterium caseinilyticum]